MQTESTTVDLLADEFYYERASAGKRLANLIIDSIAFYVFVFVLFFGLAIVAPDFFVHFEDESTGFKLADRLFSMLLYGLFMALIEGVFKGKSLGKLITRTRAVNLDGSPISFGTAFGRGFIRAIPFCVFSAFGTPCNPWQDRWTNTMVIDEK